MHKSRYSSRTSKPHPSPSHGPQNKASKPPQSKRRVAVSRRTTPWKRGTAARPSTRGLARAGAGHRVCKAVPGRGTRQGSPLRRQSGARFRLRRPWQPTMTRIVINFPVFTSACRRPWMGWWYCAMKGEPRGRERATFGGGDRRRSRVSHLSSAGVQLSRRGSNGLNS